MAESGSLCFIEADWPLSGVHACSTTRLGGLSESPYDGFNLATHVADDASVVAQNRILLRAGLNLPSEPVWLEQVHADGVIDAASAIGSPQADASYTTAEGVVCAVLTADCLPVLFATADGGAVAAAHAGWRGLASGVLEATVASLSSTTGCQAGDIFAWLGPAIGPAAFEVGEGVRSAFTAIDSALAEAFVAGQPGHWQADIYALARGLLNRCGVSGIYGGGRCTFSERDFFYSYRREPRTGRMASLIWRD
jgi:hypothetical protein